MQREAEHRITGVESGDHRLHDSPSLGQDSFIEPRIGEPQGTRLENDSRVVAIPHVLRRDLRHMGAPVGKGLNQSLGLELADRFADGDQRYAVRCCELLEAQMGSGWVVAIDDRLSQVTVHGLDPALRSIVVFDRCHIGHCRHLTHSTRSADHMGVEPAVQGRILLGLRRIAGAHNDRQESPGVGLLITVESFRSSEW